MSLDDFEYAGATVVLTGAASGMGEAMARQLGASGARLVLIDRHAERLAAVADELPGEPTTHVADLGDRDELMEVARRIAADEPAIDMLINNAGVALFGRFDEMELADFESVTNVNLRAPIYLTHTLLPSLRARPGSHIVNLSSLFGVITPSGQSAYCTSKFGLRGFSGALGVELAGDRIGVTSVHPGGIATRIASDGRRSPGMDERDFEAQQRASRKLLTMPPEKAAGIILNAARRRRTRVMVGKDAVALDLVARAMPSRINRLIIRSERRLTRRR